MAVKVPLVRDSTTNLPIELSASDTIAKASVGLGNVDNTSDASKPVSTAQATAIAAKFDKSGGSLTGSVSAPTFNMTGTTSGTGYLFSDRTSGSLAWNLYSTGGIANLFSYVSGGNVLSINSSGNMSVVGTISGSNLSGTNTGDQDLSGLLPKANLSGFTKFAVVTSMPGSPDPNTIYFVK